VKLNQKDIALRTALYVGKKIMNPQLNIFALTLVIFALCQAQDKSVTELKRAHIRRW